MRIRLNILYVFLMVGFINIPCTQAMDVKPSPILQLPDDVLLMILSFVVEKDPNAIGNLLAIQTVSKRLQGVLSDKQITWIAELTQGKLRLLMDEALGNLDAKKVRLWIRFGLRATAPEVAITLDKLFKKVVTFHIHETSNGRVPPQYEEDNVLEIAKMLFELGGDGVGGHIESLKPIIQLGWYKTLKYALEHGISVDSATWRTTVESDQADMIQLMIDSGANPNITSDDIKPPLYYVRSPKVARILLDGGARLYVDCAGARGPTLSEAVLKAKELKDQSLITAMLLKNYGLQAATAIALALMAGASLAGMMCTIL